MRKLIFGLAAILSLVFAMSSNALAQETTDEDPTNEFPVQCTMLNFTDPSFHNEDGTYDVGTPISLELIVPKGGPMDWFFVASLNGGDDYRLNDESLQAIGWTPIDPGTYTVRGEFIDENGNVLEVEDPAACMVTLTVVAVQPTPEPTAPTCGEPETLTLVPNPGGWTDVYNADGELCAQVAAEQPAQPAAPASVTAPAELPRTGTATTVLAIAGICLVVFGMLLKFIMRYLPYARPMR